LRRARASRRDKPCGDDLIKPGRLVRARLFHATLPIVFAARQKNAQKARCFLFRASFGRLTLLP